MSERIQSGNDRLIRALLREPVDMTPVWIMRQAGRYLPEYRDTRRRAGSFLNLCKTPELACEVSLQPLARFDLDAAIVFSDILIIPDAMGLGLSVLDSEGPCLERTIRSRADIDHLGNPDPEVELGYVMDAVRLIRRELNGRVPLIGFAGSPWTLAVYMVEGGASKDYSAVKGMVYREPALLHRLLERVVDVVTSCLNAQIAAGAQVIMVFDTWGGILTRAAYLEFSLASISRVVAGLTRSSGGRRVPIIVFSKGAGPWIAQIAECGCDAIGLDWTAELGAARSSVRGRVALQGNLDPSVLSGSPELIRRETAAVLASYGRGSGHVFNLGHGIQPDTDPDHVRVLVEAVHELSRKYHQVKSDK